MPVWMMRFYRRIRARREVGLLFLLALLVGCLVLNAVFFYIFEKEKQPELTMEDCLWQSVVSISTIGYGDYYPETTGGRLTVFLTIIVFGLSIFTVFMGVVIDLATEQILKGRRGMRQVHSSGHVVLIHFPGPIRVRQVIDELASDPIHRDREIVVVTDQIEQLPFNLENVRFVHGSPLAVETYERANIEKAAMALVLATSYSESTSDAVVASVVSVLDKLNPSLHIVAECTDERHRMLFNSVRCNAVVPGLRIAGNLLVQEVHDPGITQMIDVITSNLKGETLFSTRTPEGVEEHSCSELAKRALDEGINLLCINRGPESHLVFCDLNLRPGDNLIYLAGSRKTWKDFESLLA